LNFRGETKTVLCKCEFPNGCTFIWLGKGDTWGKGEKKKGINNVLILEGGEVLFLKTVKVLPLHDEKVKNDLKKLNCEEFINKYNLPSNIALWKDLKEGIESGKYPPSLKLDLEGL
jgi:hypothetical protein